MAPLERLDYDHSALTVRASRGGPGLAGILIAAGFALQFRGFEQLSGFGDVFLAHVVGEEAVMADAVEAGRQGVTEEAADELVRLEAHVLLA